MFRACLGAGVGWIGLSLLSDGIPTLVLPHRLLADGHTDATTLGLVSLVALGLAATLQPFAGLLSDRAGRAPVTALGVAVAIAGLALLAAPGAAFAGAILALLGCSVAQAGYQPIVADRIRPSWRGRASGLKNAFDVGGALAGFVLLSVLLGSGHASAALAAAGAALVISLVIAAALLPPDPSPWSTGDRRHPALRVSGSFIAIVAARFAFLVGVYAVGRFLVLLAADRLTLDADGAAAAAGTVLMVLAAVTVAASLPSGWLADRFGRGPLLLAGGTLGAAGIAGVAAADSMAGMLAAGVLLAVGSGAFASASWALLADLAPPTDSGWLLGLANLGTVGAAAAAGAFGPVIDLVGFGAALAVAAGFALVGGLVGWLGSERRTAAPVVPATEVAG